MDIDLDIQQWFSNFIMLRIISRTFKNTDDWAPFPVSDSDIFEEFSFLTSYQVRWTLLIWG